MQIAEDSQFGYTSAYWTDDNLLNENSAPTDNVNAKYAAFLSSPFNTIRMCSGSVDTNCVSYTFDRTWNNLLFFGKARPARRVLWLQLPRHADAGSRRGCYSCDDDGRQRKTEKTPPEKQRTCSLENMLVARV